LELRDDQGAFALPSTSVELPRDVAIRIRFSVVPKGNTQLGFLRLIDADKNVAMHEIPLEVRAPQRMQTIVPGVQRYETRIPPRKREQQVFVVDSRAQAIGVSIEMPDVGFRGPGDVALTAPGQQVTYFPIPQKAGVPLDKEHHIGPMQHVETVISGTLTGLWKLDWDNRGIPEYETPYDSPAPDLPISARLTVSNYAVSLERAGTTKLKAHNLLADINGHVEFLTGKMRVQTLSGTQARGYASTSVRVEPGTAIWRLRIQAATRDLQAHVFVLNCSGQLPWSPCIVVRQANLRNGQATFPINDPEAGEWRVAILPDNDLSTKSYELEHVMLKASDAKDSKLPNSATSEVTIPSNLVAESAGENLSYAAFRLAPIGEQEKGTLIALTPLNEASF